MDIIEWACNLWQKPRITFKQLQDSVYSQEFLRISSVLNTKLARQIIWHIINQTELIPLCPCSKPLAWNNDKHQYRDFCSKKCTATYTQDQIKITNLKKHGVAHYSQTTEYREKVKNTSLRKFGKEHYSKTTEFKQRTIETNQVNFGVDYPAQSQAIQEKMQKKYIERYGVNNPMKSTLVKEKLSTTNLEKYGVDNPLKSPEIREQAITTLKQKYGVTNPGKNPTIKQRAVETRKRKYYTTEVYSLLHNAQWLEDQNKQGKSIGQISEDLGVSSSNLCKYFHNFGIEITKHFRSAMEADLCGMLSALGLEYKCNVRNIIYPYEIDIWLPDFKLGIELNGAYYHSEQHGKNSNYHLLKTTIAESKSIQLLQFFDWEFFNNSDVIIDKISHLTKRNKKIGARQLTIQFIDNKTANSFYKENHLQGPCHADISIGLLDNNGNVLSAASFGKSRYTKKYDHELIRFACKNQLAVIGSASRLLKFYISNCTTPGQTIVSYCNRRWSTGGLYNTLGFTLAHTSEPGYYYVTKNGEFAGSRQRWQKHLLSKKLTNFDAQLTEWQNMQINGYSRVWDCGQYVFVMKI